jgi:hypothetical protein
MSEAESKTRAAAVIYFPMFIATLSLVTSIYNGYLNNRFVELIQENLGRTEAMHTCKDVIDAYFQVKFRAGIVSENGARERATGTPVPGAAAAQIEALNAVNKVGALGTYLANLSNERARDHYTRLTEELEKIAKEAPRLAPADLNSRFGAADELFSGMNSDCVKSAKR